MSNLPDELARAGVAAAVAQWQLSWHLSQRQVEIRDAAIEEIKRLSKTINDCRTACRAFGYDPEDKEKWGKAMEAFGRDARQLFNKTRPPDVPAWGDPLEDEKPATAIASDASAAGAGDTPSTPEMPRIKDVVLSQLEEAGYSGGQAASIRQYIEKTYSTTIHEKTVGMTLYRLLKDGRVRRKGHKWFFVPPVADTKNPAGETAGLEDLLS